MDRYEFKSAVNLPEDVHDRSRFVSTIEQSLNEAAASIKTATGQDVAFVGKMVRVVNRVPKAAAEPVEPVAA